MTDTTSVESINFKQVPGGFVFRAPSTWLFGRANHYLATETQKHEIVAILAQRRPVLFLTMLWLILCLMVAAACLAVWAYTGHDTPTTLDIAVMIAIVAVEVVAGLQLLFWWRLRRLRPILGALRPTEEKITYRDMQAAATDVASVKQLTVVTISSACACTVFAFSFILYLALGMSLLMALFQLVMAVLMGLITVIWARRLIAKAQQQRAVT
jgi:hypothetical protein